MPTKKENKTKIIKARVNDYEESLIKAKAEFYGYKNISKYIIDSAIYERVTYTNIENQELLYNAYSENTKELKKITKEIRYISKYATNLDIETTKKLISLMFTIIRKQKQMINLIDTKINLKVYQEINRNKEIAEEKKICPIQKE